MTVVVVTYVEEGLAFHIFSISYSRSQSLLGCFTHQLNVDNSNYTCDNDGDTDPSHDGNGFSGQELGVSDAFVNDRVKHFFFIITGERRLRNNDAC